MMKILILVCITIVVGGGGEKKRGLAPRRLMDRLLQPPLAVL